MKEKPDRKKDFFGGENYSVGTGHMLGFLYTNTEIFSLLRFSKVSRNTSSPLITIV